MSKEQGGIGGVGQSGVGGTGKAEVSGWSWEHVVSGRDGVMVRQVIVAVVMAGVVVLARR